MARKFVTWNGAVVGSAPADITPTTWLVFDGDSITWGRSEGDAAGLSAFPALVGNMVRAAQPSEIVADINLGITGNSWNFDWNVSPEVGTMITRAPTYVDPILSKSGTKWLCAFAGTNGYGIQGNSATTEYNNLLTYFNARISAGWSASQIIIPVMLPREAGAETFRTAYNSSIISGASTYGYKVARFDQNAAFDQQTDSANTTYFLDGLHPTIASGHPLLAQIIYNTMFP